jgi:hypothetical protein
MRLGLWHRKKRGYGSRFRWAAQLDNLSLDAELVLMSDTSKPAHSERPPSQPSGGRSEVDGPNAELDGGSAPQGSTVARVILKRVPVLVMPSPVAAVPRPSSSVPRPISSVPRPVSSVPRPISSVPRPVSSVPKPGSAARTPVPPPPWPLSAVRTPVPAAPWPLSAVPTPVPVGPGRVSPEPRPPSEKTAAVPDVAELLRRGWAAFLGSAEDERRDNLLTALKQSAAQAVKRDPDCAFGYFVLGKAAALDGLTVQASRLLRKAIELDPSLDESPAARNVRAGEADEAPRDGSPRGGSPRQDHLPKVLVDAGATAPPFAPPAPRAHSAEPVAPARTGDLGILLGVGLAVCVLSGGVLMGDRLGGAANHSHAQALDKTAPLEASANRLNEPAPRGEASMSIVGTLPDEVSPSIGPAAAEASSSIVSALPAEASSSTLSVQPAEATSSIAPVLSAETPSSIPSARPTEAPSPAPSALPTQASSSTVAVRPAEGSRPAVPVVGHPPQTAPAASASSSASASPPVVGQRGPESASDVGTVVLPAWTRGHRIYVDGRVVGEGPDPLRLKCGSRVMRLGSAGQDQQVIVPCGGEVRLAPERP